MEWLERELGVVQVSKRGTMVDELDFPAEALREAISNALIHRSLGPISESTTIGVRVTPATVEITSAYKLTNLGRRQLERHRD